MNLSLLRLLAALAMTMVGTLFVTLVPGMMSDALSLRLFDTANMQAYYGFTIQNIMWVLFFITLGELGVRLYVSLHVGRGLAQSYLPEDGHSILELHDMPAISRRIAAGSAFEGSLAEFIKKLVMQFQSSRSIEQTQNMLNAQLEMQGSLIDTRYSMIRYLVWLIPTMGFIGTVIGISSALAYAGDVNGQGENFVAVLTSKLAVAFDTTFVALVMSAVLVFLMHVIQGREETNLVKIGQYCLDNLINRLYINT